MQRRSLRSALFGTALLVASVPSVGQAQQSVFFEDCTTAGVCGYVNAFFASSILTVRVSNLDAIVGSALFNVQLIFANALNPATPGAAFTEAADVALTLGTTAIGTIPLGAWSFNGVGGSNVLDLAGFSNVFIEGTAPSPFRAQPDDPFAGTWVTNKGFVEFTADLSSVTSLAGNSIGGLGFCTDVGCAQGVATATPEPATLTLLATGLAGLAAARRRRRTTV